MVFPQHKMTASVFPDYICTWGTADRNKLRLTAISSWMHNNAQIDLQKLPQVLVASTMGDVREVQQGLLQAYLKKYMTGLCGTWDSSV